MKAYMELRLTALSLEGILQITLNHFIKEKSLDCFKR